MAVVIMDGRVRAYWATAISNVAAPTTTELNAGTDLTPYITPDGLDISASTGKVDVGNVGSTFTLNRVGRKTFTINLTLHHDATSGNTDPAWSLLVYRTLGFFAVRTGIDKATAWASGQGGGGANGQLQVFPVEAAEYSPVKVAPDTSWDFTVELSVYSDPNTRAIVA